MMISLIVVALVGVGFTRLTMLALELRDNYEDNEHPVDMGRKRVDAHNRMVSMNKPEELVLKEDNRFEAVDGKDDGMSAMLASADATLQALFSHEFFGKTVAEEEPVERVVVEPVTLDPTDVCTICFEKAKNAVLLGCGHGGLCYNCSIDVFVTSGHCPFCRKEINQILTVGLGAANPDANGNPVVQVIGPK